MAALIKHQRYAHAKQFKRANRSLRKLKTYLGRVIRDIRRKTAGDEGLRQTLVRPLDLGRARAGAGPPPARPQDLQPACDRGGMHRQGKSTQAL